MNTDNTLVPSQYPYAQLYSYPQYVVMSVPTECSGDVHIFPCKHCRECKCGKAKLTKD